MAFPRRDFPRLADDNHEITSEATTAYNCVAWAVGEDHRPWGTLDVAPFYWPLPIGPESHTLEGLRRALGAVGFVNCDPDDAGVDDELVALYMDPAGWWQHAARRLPNGHWTSKMGVLEDISHTDESAVGGGQFGEVVCYMRRPADSVAAEDGSLDDPGR